MDTYTFADELERQAASRYVWDKLLNTTKENSIHWKDLVDGWGTSEKALVCAVNSVLRPYGVVTGSNGAFWVGLPG
jgi:hypothetical protein